MIKAITFDLDGVYFINGKSNFIAALEKRGVSRVEAERVFLKSDEMNKQYKEGKMSDEQFWTWALGEWKLEMTVPEVIQLLIDGYEVNEAVVATVKKTRAKGYKTLICTNNFPARINGLHKRFNFLDNFDATALSYEAGASKPSQKIFQELVNRSGVKPGEIVFADDNLENLAGAREIGIKTFVYKDFPQFIADLSEEGVSLE